MAKQQRDLANEAHWRDVFQQFATSGLSVRGFCRRESLSEANFYAWRRTLAELENHHAERDQQPVPPLHLRPLRLLCRSASP